MVKRQELNQGDILKIEGIKTPVLVVSKNFFNMSGSIIGIPIIKNGNEGPLSIIINTEEVSGYALCEQMKLLDLKIRGFSKIERITIDKIIDITDAIQSIFDYI